MEFSKVDYDNFSLRDGNRDQDKRKSVWKSKVSSDLSFSLAEIYYLVNYNGLKFPQFQ